MNFGYKGLPGFAFGSFHSATGFGPDDIEIICISRGRGGFYFSSTFSSTTDGVDAFGIKPNGITFFGLRFTFRYGVICYVGKNVNKMLDGIFQIVGIISTQIRRSFRRKGGPVAFR